MIPALGQLYGGMAPQECALGVSTELHLARCDRGPMACWSATAWHSAAMRSADSAAAGSGSGSGASGSIPIPPVAPLIPHQLFMLFEMLVAVFAAALISGAIAERVKFSSYLLFMLLWSTFVYAPVAHWVWGPDGWIKKLGALDFAGGLVVHLTSGLAALCCVVVVGKRKGLDHEDFHPHSLTLTAIGTGLLWFGWQGLNAGQARSANAAAVAAFVATNLSGAAAIVSWSILEYLQKRKVTVLGACTGAIAGLVAVSPAAGYVEPLGAFAIGFMVAPLCYFAILLKGQAGLRRLARRLRSAWRRRACRCAVPRFSGGPEPDLRVGRLARRERRSAAGAGDRRGGRGPLHGCCQPVLLLPIDRLSAFA